MYLSVSYSTVHGCWRIVTSPKNPEPSIPSRVPAIRRSSVSFLNAFEDSSPHHCA
jgi:hypothetical protein